MTRSGRAAVAVVALTLLAAAGVGLTYTPLFRLETIRIVGARHLSEDDVLRLAGIEGHVNLAHLDLRRAERALERDPRIADATFVRQLPSTLTIDVVERHAVALTATADGTGAVAPDGTILPGVRGSGLPEIRAAVGVLADEGRDNALTALVAIPRDVRSRLAAIVVQPDGTLVFEIADGPMVEYGPATSVSAKGEAMRAVLAWAADHDIELGAVDVAAPAAPTARTLDGAPVEI
jgi:cell division protein FtsQ